MPVVVRHRLDGQPPPGGRGRARHRRRAAPGRDRRRRLRRGRRRARRPSWSRPRSRSSGRSARPGRRRRRCSRSTSGPPGPGATEIVSVHLSADMSGTFESAPAGGPGRVGARSCAVDSRQVGVATGYAALSAADVVACGRHRRGGGRRPRWPGPRRRPSLFYVDTLEYLRRGGRIGAAAALFGGALAVKPLLADRRRQGGAAWSGCARRAGRWPGWRSWPSQAAGDAGRRVRGPPGVARTGPAQLTEQLTDRLADNLEGREVWCGELGAVLGAHVGPGHARGLRRAAALTPRSRPQATRRVAVLHRPPEAPVAASGAAS